MTENYNGLEVFSYQFDRFAYEHPWIGAQVGEFMLGPEGGGMLEFARATVFALPEGGAHEVHGPIVDWYLGHGGPYGALGYPISNERPTPTGSGRYNLFQRGAIGWLPDEGAFIIGGRHEVSAVDGSMPSLGVSA
ncbi:LGFP repeat protein [Rhodococcus sp. AW25M09]|uniref:LGFP repeat-containing protein n=1 Tax=Rhodococcus sp. AW25M09 TaxID=1268303 RepID=UPI0002AD07BC|nr:LGFP repeat protein [Rhodococcus sp. AW25M09]CCQ14927.1 LGFP repeat protein [Rhodococcus sp. AW25M09]